MSRKCVVLKKGHLTGNNVSHANNKTKRMFLPNMQTATFFSNILQQNFKLKISAKAVKTIDFYGGLDNFVLSRKVNALAGDILTIYKKLKAVATPEQIASIKLEAKRGVVAFNSKNKSTAS